MSVLLATFHVNIFTPYKFCGDFILSLLIASCQAIGIFETYFDAYTTKIRASKTHNILRHCFWMKERYICTQESGDRPRTRTSNCSSLNFSCLSSFSLSLSRSSFANEGMHVSLIKVFMGL